MNPAPLLRVRSRAENFCRALRFTPRYGTTYAVATFTRRKSLRTFAKNFLMHARKPSAKFAG